MGQQHSQEHHDISENFHDPELSNVQDEIRRLRQELQELKQEGENKQQQYREELETAGSQFNDSVQRFHACRREATSIFQFWDYHDILQQEEQKKQEKSKVPTRSSPPSPPTSSYTTTSLSSTTPETTSNNTTEKPSTTAVAETTLSAISTQFCMNLVRIFQAHLLRKVHLGVMLEKQRKKQATGWNKIVMLYFTSAQDKAGKAFQKLGPRVLETMELVEVAKQEKQDLIGRILNLQQEIMDKLSVKVSNKPPRRRSSIEDIRQSKRELEMLRHTISPDLSRKVVDLTIELVPSSTMSMTDEEESKKEDKLPELLRMMRRSSIEDIKARNRELELNRLKTLSPTDEPHIVTIWSDQV